MARVVMGKEFPSRPWKKPSLFLQVIARSRPRRGGSYLFSKPWAGRMLSWVPWERVVPFPHRVTVELTTKCNLMCPMCPRAAMAPEHGFIEERLFRKIVDEIVRRKGVCFIPGGRGEAMVHPQWEEFIAYAKHAGVSPMHLNTNCTLLNRDRAQFLIDCGVDAIQLAVDGATKETYEAIRAGANFEQVLANVRQLLDLRRRAGTGKPLIVMRMTRRTENEPEIEAFVEYWQKHLSEHDEIKIPPMTTWVPVRDMESVISEIEATRYAAIRSQPLLMAPCRAMWKMVSIRYDGKMTVCLSRDLDLTLVNANAHEVSIAEAWKSPALTQARRLHLLRRKLDIPACRRCLALLHAGEATKGKA